MLAAGDEQPRQAYSLCLPYGRGNPTAHARRAVLLEGGRRQITQYQVQSSLPNRRLDDLLAYALLCVLFPIATYFRG